MAVTKPSWAAHGKQDWKPRAMRLRRATVTAAPRPPTPPPLFFFFFFLLRVRLLLLRWRCLHEVVCAEYEGRPKATELFV
ncbi:hypothetical protein TCDM_08648 [Trypanosoma cruzi Dm28c]|uniref:Uncharacterized protein n=1 Tax=Trypanosoma cruzi Dm28c TaxID=1416333 RepID=V5ARS9_TRYCR|nr:hypothetical protein TCDM_08648 [Trypanosoma cruzi Dm28c]